MNQLAKTDLLILDDWGIPKMAAAQRNDLLELIEDRHGLRATLADAILDRLLHNAHRLPLKGESLRKRHQQSLDSQKQPS